MPTQDHYKWLETQLRLQAAVLTVLTLPDGPDEPCRMRLIAVTAQAGTFESPPVRSANDGTAARLAMLLILLPLYAKTRAKSRETGPFLREIRGGAKRPPVTPEPAWLLAASFFAALLARCQNDHLPTRMAITRNARNRPLSRPEPSLFSVWPAGRRRW